VIGLDPEKRQLRLSMKQLIPTGFAEYMEEHKVGDVVSGRVVEQSADSAIVELGDGIRVTCLKSAKAAVEAKSDSGAALDLSSLTSMLNARWKTGAPAAGSQPEPLGVGQVRSFRLVKLDPEAQQIEVELA